MTIIDSLKRLERAGSEESKATEKLQAAAREVSDYVVSLLPFHVQLEYDRRDGSFMRLHVPHLPGGYVLDWNAEGQGKALYTEYPDGDVESVYGSRQAALSFAVKIATGWLDELAERLEQRAADATEAATTLENAKH